MVANDINSSENENPTPTHTHIHPHTSTSSSPPLVYRHTGIHTAQQSHLLQAYLCVVPLPVHGLLSCTHTHTPPIHYPLLLCSLCVDDDGRLYAHTLKTLTFPHTNTHIHTATITTTGTFSYIQALRPAGASNPKGKMVSPSSSLPPSLLP